MMPLEEMSVDQLVAEAQHLVLPSEQIRAALAERIQRDQAYLRRRRRHGLSTATDMLIQGDLLILAAAIARIQGDAEPS